MPDHRILVVAVSLGLLAACSPPSESSNKADLQSLEIGIHEIEFSIPAGWFVMDTGLGPILRTGESDYSAPSVISFEDLGPCTPEGIRRTLLEAREHCRAGRFGESRQLLDQISLDQIVVIQEDIRSFDNAWSRVRSPNHPRRGARPEEFEPAYQKLLDRAALIPRRSIEELAREHIEEVSQNGRHETVKTDLVEVDGKPALVIDTWDRLSHKMRRRYLLLINDDNLFFMNSNFGKFPEIDAAFQQLLPSLQFSG